MQEAYKEIMEDSHKCPKCGNTKRFYREISIPAKERLDNTDGTEGKIYDIDTEQYDNEFDGVYCFECGTCVNDDDLDFL